MLCSQGQLAKYFSNGDLLNATIKNEADTVAHELAKLAKGLFCNSFLDEQPGELIPRLLNDVALVANSQRNKERGML